MKKYILGVLCCVGMVSVSEQKENQQNKVKLSDGTVSIVLNITTYGVNTPGDRNMVQEHKRKDDVKVGKDYTSKSNSTIVQEPSIIDGTSQKGKNEIPGEEKEWSDMVLYLLRSKQTYSAIGSGFGLTLSACGLYGAKKVFNAYMLLRSGEWTRWKHEVSLEVLCQLSDAIIVEELLDDMRKKHKKCNEALMLLTQCLKAIKKEHTILQDLITWNAWWNSYNLAWMVPTTTSFLQKVNNSAQRLSYLQEVLIRFSNNQFGYTLQEDSESELSEVVCEE